MGTEEGEAPSGGLGTVQQIVPRMEEMAWHLGSLCRNTGSCFPVELNQGTLTLCSNPNSLAEGPVTGHPAAGPLATDVLCRVYPSRFPWLTELPTGDLSCDRWELAG